MNRRAMQLLSGVALAGALFAGAVTATGGASASTLSCTDHESCGGADLNFSGHGQLSLSVLDTSTVNAGFGYNNERVGFNTSGQHNGTQDFTVFQQSGETPGHGGVYGFGNYTVMYTPGGHLPFTHPGGGALQQGDTVTATDETSVPYCISVEDTYPVVGGHKVQRWALVLRNCFATHNVAFTVGTHADAATSTTEVEATVSHPNLYQEFAPTETSDGFLKFQDVALNNSHLRHGFGGRNFVMDDRGFGGPGTWGIVFPEKDVTQNASNQEFTIIGCTEPVTVFNSQYFDCAGV